MKSGKIEDGGMGEWLKPAVLKTVELERVPGVRIPLPPPDILFWFHYFKIEAACLSDIQRRFDQHRSTAFLTRFRDSD